MVTGGAVLGRLGDEQCVAWMELGGGEHVDLRSGRGERRHDPSSSFAVKRWKIG